MLLSSAFKEITALSPKDCFYIVDRKKSEFDYPLHYHAEYELNFVRNAAGVKRIVGDSEEVIGDYDLVLITGEDVEHMWEQHQCRSTDIREITIQFSDDMFLPNLINKNLFDSVRRMFEKAKKGLCFPKEAIMSVCAMLDQLASTKDFYTVIDFLTILYKLSLFTDRSKTLASDSFVHHKREGIESKRVHKTKVFINEHYKEELRLTQLAELCKMSPGAFSRFFKLQTGKGLIEYIIDVRLGQAARMLVNTTASVTEIGYDCGFNNLSNFNRLFRQRKNCSPKEFRNNFYKTKVLI
ncbi:AraC family transcriptional regulator [Bacteroidia bacterium]|nr:AraC family transcriptional regulator [Bacteroidia bacterium]